MLLSNILKSNYTSPYCSQLEGVFLCLFVFWGVLSWAQRWLCSHQPWRHMQLVYLTVITRTVQHSDLSSLQPWTHMQKPCCTVRVMTTRYTIAACVPQGWWLQSHRWAQRAAQWELWQSGSLHYSSTCFKAEDCRVSQAVRVMTVRYTTAACVFKTEDCWGQRVAQCELWQSGTLQLCLQGWWLPSHRWASRVAQCELWQSVTL